MIVEPIAKQNHIMRLAAENTRRTILHLQDEIARLEKYEAHCLELAGEPESEPGIREMAGKLAPRMPAAMPMNVEEAA
jgi:hypothetical protein